MYKAAEKWGEDAKTDEIRARAESCMATLTEMKLRVEKMPAAQHKEERTMQDIKALIEELEVQYEAWGKQYTFPMIIRDIEKFAAGGDADAESEDR